MRYSESFLLFLLCAELPPAVGNFGVPLTARHWHTLCTVLGAGGLSPLDLWDGDAVAAVEPAGEPIFGRVKKRLSLADAAWQEWQRLADRGIRVCALCDSDYPPLLLQRMGKTAPPVLFVAGDTALAAAPAVGIVGSRDADEESRGFASLVAAACVAENVVVISGGAVGVDTAAVSAALDHGGNAVVCCADRMARQRIEMEADSPERAARVLWLSAAHPDASFVSHRALERNRFIYSMAAFTVIVSADAGKGGTWSGATDSLRHRWSPLFVRSGTRVRDGNRLLLSRADVASLSVADLNERTAPLLDWFAARHPLLRYEQLGWF